MPPISIVPAKEITNAKHTGVKMSWVDRMVEQHADPIPNPGSDEALTKGCTCPVLDNGYGEGSGWGPGKFWINFNCPLHGPKNVKET